MSILDSVGRVVVLMGKGGVGKTTVAAGLGALAAEVEGAAVVVEFGDGEAGRRALAGVKGVEHIVIEADEAIARGARGLFGSGVLSRLALNNFAMRRLLRAAPAVRELAMLEALRQVVAERPRARVVVDMPATGHGVAWLRTARQGRDFLGAGALFEMCDRVVRELVSPGRLSPVVVTLAEALVLEETGELAAALARDPGVRPAAYVVNRVPSRVSSDAMEGLAAMSGELVGVARLRELAYARALAGAEAWRALAAGGLEDVPVWHMPLHVADPHAAEVAAALGGLRAERSA